MRFFILIWALLVCCPSGMKAGIDNPTALAFRSDGTFKIVQFTDIHYQTPSLRSDSVLRMMRAVAASEKPDLIVLTGDNVCSDHTAKAWRNLADTLAATGFPWCIVFGNHDQEHDLSKPQIIKLLRPFRNHLTQEGPEELPGTGNYILSVASSQGNGKAALLYFLDSHSSLNSKVMGTYDWLKAEQIVWYRKESQLLQQAAGGSPLPALAFFHIPVPEYKELVASKQFIGICKEAVCSPDVNTGMYAAMLERGDVMGLFTGHDHDNNFIGQLRGLCLAYGQATGKDTYGRIGQGARVILLYEGQRKFDTWIVKGYEQSNSVIAKDPSIPLRKIFTTRFENGQLSEI
ncbi:MAG: metallophosphoesterase family protein [Bacteroidales bacterium]